MKSVGIVQNLDGKFYVQEVNGNVKILKVGDTLVQGDKVFGDPANLSSNKLNIIGNDGNLLTVSGVDSAVFDTSTNESSFGNEEVAFVPKNLWSNGNGDENIDDNIVADAENKGDITEEETAAGEESPTSATSTDNGVFSFHDRIGDSVNVVSDLRVATFPDNQDETISGGTNSISSIAYSSTISLNGLDVNEDENNATFTITFSNPTLSESVVTVDAGTEEYTFTIPAGSTTFDFDIPTKDSDVYNDPDTLTVTVTSVTGGGFNNVDLTDATVTINIDDTIDTTTVSVTTTDVNEDSNEVTFNFETSNKPQTGTTSSLTVDVNGTEYTVTLDENGKGSLSLDTQDSDVYKDEQSITATVKSINGGNFEATDVNGATATAKVTDTINDTTLTLNDVTVDEGSNTATISATLTSAPTDTPLVVTLNNGSTITFNVGETTATSTPFTIQGDDVYNDSESYTLSVSSYTGGSEFENLITTDTATVKVNDTIDTTTVTLSGSSVVEEAGTATYTITVSNKPQTDLTITINISHKDTDNNDLEPKIINVTIPTGETSVSFDVSNLSDIKYEGSEDYLVSIAKDFSGNYLLAGGNYENLVVINDSVTTTIADNDNALKANNDLAIAKEEGTEWVGNFSVTNAPSESIIASGNILSNDGINNGNAKVLTITVENTEYQISESGDTDINTQYGTLTINQNGEFTFIVNDNNTVVNSLNVNDMLPVGFSYTIGDGVNTDSSAILTINIEGTNDAPIISSITADNKPVHTVTSVLDLDNDGNGDYISPEQLLNGDGNNGLRFNEDNGNIRINVGNGDSSVSVDYFGGNAGYKNILGFYEKDVSGNITDVKIIYVDKGDDDNNGSNFDSFVNAPINLGTLNNLNGDIGFFVVPNGYNDVNLKSAIDSNNYSVEIDSSNKVVFTYTDTNGSTQTASIDKAYYTDNSMSTDGRDHAIVTLDPSGGLVIGLEDLPENSTDQDYDDIVIRLNLCNTQNSNHSIVDNISLSDIDNDTLSSATITVTNYKNGDIIGTDNLPSGISATTTINSLGHLVVTLNGTATVLEYENAIESLTFTSTSADRTPRDFEFVVNDGNKDSNTMSLKVDIGGCIINTYSPDNDAPIIVDATAVVSEEGLINGITDDVGSTDTTNNTTIIGKMNITDTENNALDINLTSPNTTITAGGIEVVWSGNGTKELVGTANNTQVIKISIDNNGNYEVKLFASVDHPQNSIEDTLNFDVGVTASDGTNVTNGTLSVTIEDDMPTVNSTNAVVINIDNSQFTNLVINGSFEDITGHRVAGSGDVGFIVDQDISSGSWSGMQSMEGWELISGRSFWMEPHHIEHAGVGVTDGTNYMDLGETNQNNDSDMDNTHIGQIIGCIQDGAIYNLSFAFKDKAFTQANEPQSGKMEVIWGGDVIATIDGDTTDWETFTIEVIGGYGNGSNRLEFKEIGEGSDNWGIAIDNVSMSAKSITYSGNIAADAGVLINFGADGQADGSGTKVDSSKLSFALAETSGWTLQNNGSLVSDNGNITISIDGTTGDYTITQTGVIDNVSLNIPVTITDGDGDSVTTDIKLNAQNTPVCELPSQIFATIINNDSVTEGGVLSHKVVLVDVNGNEVRIPAGEFVEINLTYVANSTNGATQGADYTAQETVRIYGGTSGVLVFNSTINDNNFENNESYTVSITGISSSDTTLDSRLNISSTQSSVTGTIIDDDTNMVIATDDYGTATVAQGEFVVDAFADGKVQSAPNVASLKDGGFVIAWTEVSGNSYNGAVSNDLNNDGDLNDSGEITWATRINHDVFIQRYDADGEPIGEATRVNTLVTNVNADRGRSQHDVNVVGLENGNYLVTWTSDDQFISKDNYDNGSRYIQGQIFDVNGNPVCGEFTVARAEYDPIVALPDGGFIVTWSADARFNNTDLGAVDNPIYSDSHDGSGFGVIAQRFDALGNEVGGRVIVNQLTSNDQFDSDIVMIDDTTAIMTWQSQNGTSGNFDIYAQTLKLTPNGLEVVSNTDIAVATGSANQINPEITALSNGTAVITYQSDSNIMARTISNGTVGQEIAISSGSNPVIAALAIGFAIAYEESGAIYAKTFDGTTLSDAVKVSGSTSGQTLSSIASLKDGGYVITWQDDNGISAHRYNADGTEYHQNEFDMMEDSSIIITADRLMTNDMDPEGHTFKVVSVQDATHGNVSMDASGNITFTPDADYNGAATFKYTIQDELGATDTATVYLNVKPMGEPTIFVGTLCDSDIQSHDIVVNEGEVAILAIKVSGAEAGSIVSLALEDGTALVTHDYSSKFYYSFDGTSWTEYSGSVQLNGNDKFLVKMATLNDNYLESNEGFKLVATLNSPGSSEVSDTGTVTIIDTTIPNNIPTSVDEVQTITFGDTTHTITTNLVITFDVSASMNDTVTVNGVTMSRFEMSKNSLKSMIESYKTQGATDVNLTLFGKTSKNIGWFTADDALDYISKLTMTSQGDLLFNNSSFSAVNTKGTNYEDAISKTTSISFADHAADRTLGFFLSDGDPTVELDSNGNVTGLNTNSTLSSIDGVGGYNFNGTTMGRVDTSYFNTWNNFVDSNDIQLNVIGIGGGISDNGKKYLNMLASADGGKAQFVVDNAGDLDDALTQDIQVITGNALDNISGGDGQINIEGITVGNTVYTIQTFPEDGIAINGKGQLKFNFTTGEYSYSANSSEFTTDATESFKVTASDEDGDTTEFDVNINILTHEPSLVGDSLNNTFNYNPTATVIDGGDGYDTLKLVSNQHIDFSQIGNVIENIEEIDLSADGKNELRNITLQDVIEMTDDKNEIKITGTDEDKVTLSGEWKLNTTLSDSEFNVYSNEDETVKLKIQTDITDITVS